MKLLFIRQREWILPTWILVTIFYLQCNASIYVYNLQTNEVEYDNHMVYPYQLGSEWPPEGHVGMTVIADPEDGCTAIKPPPNATGINPWGKWFVLMKWEGCDVTVKFRNAQNATYDLAIIHKDTDFISDGQHLKFDNTTNNLDIKINAVLTFSGHYINKIKRNFLYDKNAFFHITPGSDFCFIARWYKKGLVTNSTDCLAVSSTN